MPDNDLPDGWNVWVPKTPLEREKLGPPALIIHGEVIREIPADQVPRYQEEARKAERKLTPERRQAWLAEHMRKVFPNEKDRAAAQQLLDEQRRLNRLLQELDRTRMQPGRGQER